MKIIDENIPIEECNWHLKENWLRDIEWYLERYFESNFFKKYRKEKND